MKSAVLTGYAAIAVLWAGLVVIARLAPSDLARNVYLTIFAVGALTLFAVGRRLRKRTSMGATQLDERQRGEQLAAYAGAHGRTTIVLGVLAVAAGLVEGTSGGLTISLPVALLLPLALTLFITHYALPLLLAGWRTPEPLPDDEEG